MELTKQHNIRHKYLMLETPLYRRDYAGEIIMDGRFDPPKRIFVKPRDLYHRPETTGSAIVLGNGTSRDHDTLRLFMRTNLKRMLPNYKMTYACNGAGWDTDADYYVISNALMMGYLDRELYTQFFLPREMALDFAETNVIPYISGWDAGTTAAFLACFDGNDKIFLFGFDSEGDDEEVKNLYAGHHCYLDSPVNTSQWISNLRILMGTYKDVDFYRVGVGKTPIAWQGMPNYHEVNYREATLLGDF